MLIKAFIKGIKAKWEILDLSLIVPLYHIQRCSQGSTSKMSCVETCERDWLLGARGVCNATLNGTVVCVCPEFFSGNDDWQRFNDSCQVDERIQDIVHFVIVGLIGVSCLFIAAAILFFACETGTNVSALINKSYANITFV